jgi:hypothetical protein
MSRNIFVILFNILPITLEISSFPQREREREGYAIMHLCLACLCVLFNTKELLHAEQ